MRLRMLVLLPLLLLMGGVRRDSRAASATRSAEAPGGICESDDGCLLAYYTTGSHDGGEDYPFEVTPGPPEVLAERGRCLTWATLCDPYCQQQNQVCEKYEWRCRDDRRIPLVAQNGIVWCHKVDPR